MKYLYTLFALFLILGLSAQTTITFSEAGLTASACDGNIKGDSGVTATIADDGAGNKYLSASSGAVGSGNDWKNTQIRLTNELGDGYNFTNHLVAGAGSSISFKIWTEDLSAIAKNANGDPFTGMIKFEKGLNGAEIRNSLSIFLILAVGKILLLILELIKWSCSSCRF